MAKAKTQGGNLKDNWMLGFLGFLSIQGFRYFTTANWNDVVWFVWILWFAYFIPIKK